ncbi:uncharacterized protein JCM15063_002428 [Sporobolomyces koalae]|uniref:uncharacterized protein n=1 Tax=Sporobolomyces koalae TaxID=500713 RepID=UPI00316FC4E6
MTSSSSHTSFLKAPPSRILDHLKILRWPDGRQSESWNNWARNAISVLQEYMWDLAHPGDMFHLKGPLSEKEEHVFPAKEFLELEAALKTLVDKRYKSVEEVSVVETGWDQVHSFMVEHLKKAWQEHPINVARQYEILNVLEEFVASCIHNHTVDRLNGRPPLTPQGLRDLLAGDLYGPTLSPWRAVPPIHMWASRDFPQLQPFTFDTVLKCLDLVKTALVEVKVHYPAEWTTRQNTDFLQKTGWDVFHRHLHDALFSQKEALLKMRQSNSKVERVLRGLLKDLIKIEYDIVKGKLGPHDVWTRLEQDWLKAKRRSPAAHSEPSEPMYAYLAEALHRNFTEFPRLVQKPKDQLSLAAHHLTHRKQAIYVD